MAPLGSAGATATRAARPRSRSRSRSAEPKPSSSSRGPALPQLKEWVLTRVSTRFWSKAVPALVSRVTVGLKSEDCSLCLVLPNRFALQYGFGAAKPFLELSDVPARDVRPYHGTDHLQLHATLLKAIRDSRIGSQAVREVAATGTAAAIAGNVDLRTGLTSLVPAALAVPTKPAELAPGLTQDDGIPAAQPEPAASEAEEEAGGLSVPRSPPERAGEEADDESEEPEPATRSRSSSAVESELQLESTQEVPLEEQLASGPLQVQAEAAEEEDADGPPPAAAAAAKAPPAAEPPATAAPAAAKAPETPRRASQGRPLAQRESEPKDASNMVVGPANVPVGKIASNPVLAEEAAPVNTAARFAEFTKAVARAFKGARADELTRQELAKAVGHSFGEEELRQGLEQLDKASKIFLTGDLVFLI